MIVDIDMDAANKVVQRVGEKGGKAEAIKADIRSLAAAKKVAEATVKAFGQPGHPGQQRRHIPHSNARRYHRGAGGQGPGHQLEGTFFFCQARPAR